MKKAGYLISAFAALAFGTAVANAQTPMRPPRVQHRLCS